MGETMPSTDWTSLLQQLASAPRENGSAALDATARYLTDSLRALGWQVENLPFTAHPYEQRIMGVVLLASALLYWWSMRARRFGIASIVALSLPVFVWLHFDHGLPLSFGIGSVTEQNVVARLEVPNPQHHLIFSAHYDTKTDLLDHIMRSPVQVFGLPTSLLMIVIAFGSYVAIRVDRFSVRRRQAATLMAWVALAYGIVSFAVFTGGAFVSKRSPGALDNGAACAVLVRLADELGQTRPEHTEVELVFFAGEELALQGSEAFVARRATDLAAKKTMVVNLEVLGASKELAVVGQENKFLKRYEPSADVVNILDRVHQDMTQKAIAVTPMGGVTDGFSFMDRKIPAATVIHTVQPFILPRHMHSAADSIDRIEPGSLDQALDFLKRVVQAVDASN